MKIITVDEKTRQGRALLAQLYAPKPKGRTVINPFPFSLLENSCQALLDGVEWVARRLASAITFCLPQIGWKRRMA